MHTCARLAWESEERVTGLLCVVNEADHGSFLLAHFFRKRQAAAFPSLKAGGGASQFFPFRSCL